MFSRPTTQASMKRAKVEVKVPLVTRSSTSSGSLANFRTVRNGPPMARGWITALIREPSGRRASTMGDDSSTRRLTSPTILSMTRRRWVSSMKEVGVRSILPAALDVDPVRPVDHDFGDVRVFQVPLDGSVAEDVVGDVLAQAGLVGQRQRGGLVGQGGLQLGVDPRAKVLGRAAGPGTAPGRAPR